MIRFTMTLRDWHLSRITLPTAAMWLGFCFPKCFPICHQETAGSPLNSAGPQFCVVFQLGIE